MAILFFVKRVHGTPVFPFLPKKILSYPNDSTLSYSLFVA